MASISSIEKDSIATTRDPFKKCILACKISNQMHTNFFLYLGFYSRTFTEFTGQQRKEEAISFMSSLPLPPASQALRHQPGDYCRELTSAHSQQPDSNRKPLVFEHKSLTTKLRTYKLREKKCSTSSHDCSLRYMFCTLFLYLWPKFLKNTFEVVHTQYRSFSRKTHIHFENLLNGYFYYSSFTSNFLNGYC